MNNIKNSDTLGYFPIKDGLKPSQMGLRRLNYEDERKNRFFQIDELYDQYIESKHNAINERKSKYVRHALNHDLTYVNEFIKNTLKKEYPDRFNNNIDRANFHELAMLVQEDLVVHCINSDRDWTEAIHLCHPNGWSAETQLNWTFDQTHEKVPRMNEIGQGEKARKMIEGIVNSGNIMERIAAISFRTDAILNRHPSVPEEFKHKPFDLIDNPNLYMRFERQVMKGFKKIGLEEDSPAGFLFAIRTYFVDISKLEGEEKQAVINIFENPDPKVYSHVFIDKYKEPVLQWLKSKEK